MKRILLFGFKPYADYRVNVTESIINAFPVSKEIKKHIFDVKFDPEMFNKVLRFNQPEIIIGMGLHPRARKLRLERKARNAKSDSGDKAVLISKKGPAFRYVNMALPFNEETTITYDAGNYVCNYSMYRMCEYCETSQSKFAFIHVPEKYEVRLALAYLQQSLKSITNV